MTIQADVTSESDCERAVREAVDRFGKLDILVFSFVFYRFFSSRFRLCAQLFCMCARGCGECGLGRGGMRGVQSQFLSMASGRTYEDSIMTIPFALNHFYLYFLNIKYPAYLEDFDCFYFYIEAIKNGLATIIYPMSDKCLSSRWPLILVRTLDFTCR